MINKLLIPAIATMMMLMTQGCGPPLIIAGAAAGAAGAAIVSDKRTGRIVLEDQRIEAQAASAINADEDLPETLQVSVTSYNGVVLLTGRAPDGDAIERIIGHIRDIDNVRMIHNHVQIGAPVPLRQRSRDTMTTTRVKSALLGEQGLSSVQVKVVTDSDVVYLMGLVRRAEAEQVAQIVQRVEGVKRVVLAFELTG